KLALMQRRKEVERITNCIDFVQRSDLAPAVEGRARVPLNKPAEREVASPIRVWLELIDLREDVPPPGVHGGFAGRPGHPKRELARGARGVERFCVHCWRQNRAKRASLRG